MRHLLTKRPGDLVGDTEGQRPGRRDRESFSTGLGGEWALCIRDRPRREAVSD